MFLTSSTLTFVDESKAVPIKDDCFGKDGGPLCQTSIRMNTGKYREARKGRIAGKNSGIAGGMHFKAEQKTVSEMCGQRCRLAEEGECKVQRNREVYRITDMAHTHTV